MNLYQIDQELSQLLAEIDAAGGEITPEVEARLELSQAQFAAKADDYVKAIRNLELLAEAAQQEAARIRTLAQQRGKTADVLRRRLADALQLRGGPLQLPAAALSLRRNVSVQVDVDSIRFLELAQGFYEVRQTVAPDKLKIRKALEAGQEVPGCHLQESYSLQIR